MQVLTGPLPWAEQLLEGSGVWADVLVAAGILFVGWLVALFLARLAELTFSRLGRSVSEAGPRGALADREVGRLGRAVGRVVFWLVLALSMMAATERMGMPVVTAWLSGVANYLPRIVVAVLIVVAGLAVGRAASAGAARAAAASGVADVLRIGRLVELAVLAVTGLIAVEALGVDITFLQFALLVMLAGLLLGAALAFGLGARGLVADILACHYAERLYQVGQTIRVASEGDSYVEGRILRIVPPCVVLQTADGEVAVPGSRITSRTSTLTVEPEPRS